MLPTTTRKRLSHLRAQIRRQASKAARSRLEKRSSVSGVGGGGNNDSVSGDKGGTFGMSFDAATSKQQQLLLIQQQQQAGEGYSHPIITHQNQQQHHPQQTPSNQQQLQTHQQQQQHLHHHHNQPHHHHKELHNQPNSSSSTESPNAHSSNQSTSSPATPGTNITNNSSSSNNNNNNTNTNTNPDIQISANLSPTSLHNESGPSGATNAVAGGPSGTKLIGQHSVSGTSSSTNTTGGHHSNNHPFHQKNFKQKIIALLKKFRTDGSDFDSEEQYREALERELMKAAAGRGSRAIEELLEEDIDVEGESGSDLEDWDDISESSTPKPSLKPFFSSTTLDKI